ncbi:MAG: hypothetical protein JXA60_02410 [Candidatus Coatesbacteria bacterium]|nr:hypothetical protein [Candidatus Coatesbacteria bacterium]
MKRLAKLIKKPVLLVSIISIFILFFYTPYYLGDFERIAADISVIHLPFYKLFADNLYNGNRIYWTHLIGGGYPISGDGHTGVFNPVTNVIFYFLKWQTGLKLVFFLFLFLAWLGMYKFLVSIGICKRLSILGGAAWTFSSYMQSVQITLVMVESLAILPWMLFLTHEFNKKKHYYLFIWLLIASAIQFLFVHLQTAVYNTSFMIFFFLFSRKGEIASKKRWLYLLILLAGIAIIASPQLYSSYKLKMISSRAYGLPLKIALLGAPGLELLYTLFSPFILFPYFHSFPWEISPETSWMRYLIQASVIYIGIIPWFGFFYMLIIKRNRINNFFLLSAIIALSMVWGRINPLYWLLLKLPVFDNFGGTSRFIPYFLFSIITIGFTGWNEYLTDEKDKQFFHKAAFYSLMIYSGILLILKGLSGSKLLSMMELPGFLQNQILRLSFHFDYKMIIFPLIILVLLTIILYHKYKYKISNIAFLSMLSFIFFIDISYNWLGYTIYFPSKEYEKGPPSARFLNMDTSPFKMLSLGTLVHCISNISLLPPSSSTFWGISSDRPMMVLTQQRYRDIYEKAFNKRIESLIGDISFSNKNILDISSVKYIVSPKSLYDKNLKLVYHHDQVWIYTNNVAEEIPYFVSSIKYVKNDFEAMNVIFSENFKPREEAIIIVPSSKQLVENTGKGRIREFRIIPNGFEAKVVTDSKSLLVFPFVYSKDFESNYPLQQVQYCYTGISLPKGEHFIKVLYREVLSEYLFLMSTIALSILVLVSLFLSYLINYKSNFPRIN